MIILPLLEQVLGSKKQELVIRLLCTSLNLYLHKTRKNNRAHIHLQASQPCTNELYIIYVLLHYWWSNIIPDPPCTKSMSQAYPTHCYYWFVRKIAKVRHLFVTQSSALGSHSCSSLVRENSAWGSKRAAPSVSE